MVTKEERIQELLDRGVLISPEILERLEKLETIPEGISDEVLFDELPEKQSKTATTILENEKLPEKMNQPGTPREQSGIKIISSYDKPPKPRVYDDFVQYFRHRYKAISSMLQGRRELQGVMSINRVLAQKEDNNVAIIGIVTKKFLTKNNNIILTLEDLTGELTVIVHQRQKEALDLAKDLVLDEVIGVVGSSKDKVMFANKIYFPDIPLGKEFKKGTKEEYMIVVGDPQVGSKEFLEKEYLTFIAWLNGKIGTPEQKRMAGKVTYAVFVGDIVEGVGVYPGQEDNLIIKDIKEQYDEFARLLKKFPAHIKVVICPGNHDAGRLAEPQAPLYKDFAAALYEMSNVTIISSPGYFNIAATETFGGFDILLYHGNSIPWLADSIPSIRNAGGQKVTDQIMRFMLQRRHLAITHGLNRYIPDNEEDPLVISRVPDFFLTGHIHRIATANYRNVTMINASAWIDINEDQLKRGLEPQPGRLPIINLKTREVKVMNFYKGEKK